MTSLKLLLLLSVTLPFTVAEPQSGGGGRIRGMEVMPSRLSTMDGTGLNSQSAPQRMSELRRPHRVGINEDAPIVFPQLAPGHRAGVRPRVVPVVLSSGASSGSSSGNNEDGEDNLDVQADMDLMNANMSSRTMGMISSIRTLEDFTRAFGLEMPSTELQNDTDSEISVRFGGRSPSIDSTNAVCEPERRTVELNLTREFNVVFFPRCVRLYRCGGCCHGPLLTCQPTATDTITLKILKVETSMSAAPIIDQGGRSATHTRSRGSTRTGSNRRRRREEIASYYELQEVQHTACECRCRIMPDDCDPIVHDYVQDDCLCRCRNSDEKQKCESRRSTHYWDNRSCGCYCLKEDTCGNGERFDHDTCSCVRLSSLWLRAGLFTPRGRSGIAPGEAPSDNGSDGGSVDAAAPIVFT